MVRISRAVLRIKEFHLFSLMYNRLTEKYLMLINFGLGMQMALCREKRKKRFEIFE